MKTWMWCVLGTLVVSVLCAGIYVGLMGQGHHQVPQIDAPAMYDGVAYRWCPPRSFGGMYRVDDPDALPDGVSWSRWTGCVYGVPHASLDHMASMSVYRLSRGMWGAWHPWMRVQAPVHGHVGVQYTGHPVRWVVSSPVRISVVLWGGGGGPTDQGHAGGGAAAVSGVIHAPVGTVYWLDVGAGGQQGRGEAHGGGGIPAAHGGGGGGATTIMDAGHHFVAVAAGGGGGGVNGLFGGPGGGHTGSPAAMGSGNGVGVFGRAAGQPGTRAYGGGVDGWLYTVPGATHPTMDGRWLHGGDAWPTGMAGAGGGGSGVFGGGAGSDIGGGGGGGGASMEDGLADGRVWPGHGVHPGAEAHPGRYMDVGTGGDQGHSGGNGYIIFMW